MSPTSLSKLTATAAIGGGLLRMAAVFLTASSLPRKNLEQFYFAIDFLLLLGVFGLYARDAVKTGWLGAAGLTVFVFGILVVRSPQVSFCGTGGYQAGAAIALLGIAALSVAMLRRKLAFAAPLLWLAALAGGLCASADILPGLATALAGLLFGAGFVAAGTARSRIA
jgi:hypothetical protein